jgi:homoserine dehydrogenase
VLGDLVSVARRHVVGGPGLVPQPAGADLPLLDPGLVRTRYQITLSVRDEPGALARLAGIVAEHGVSIETVEQSRAGDDGTASLIIGTHAAPEAALRATVAALGAAGEVESVAGVLRIEGLERGDAA